MENPTVIVVANLIVGAVLPFLTEFLNQQFVLNGKRALVLAAVLAGVVSVASLFVTGGLSVADLTLENFVPTFTLVFSTSSIVFNLVKDGLNWAGK